MWSMLYNRARLRHEDEDEELGVLIRWVGVGLGDVSKVWAGDGGPSVDHHHTSATSPRFARLGLYSRK